MRAVYARALVAVTSAMSAYGFVTLLDAAAAHNGWVS